MRVLQCLQPGLRHVRLTGPIGAFAVLATACGSVAYGSAAGGYGASAAATASSASAPRAGGASGAISVNAASTRLGALLVDGQGMTLYLFEKDRPGTSACTSACFGVWPPLTAGGTVRGGAGVSTLLLSTIQRPDGVAVVEYAGHPLYHYAGDAKPGDANGQGLSQFGASWYVVSPSGGKIDNG